MSIASPKTSSSLWFSPLLVALASFAGVFLLGGAVVTLTEFRRPPSPDPSPQESLTTAPTPPPSPAPTAAPEALARRPRTPIETFRSSDAIRRAFRGETKESATSLGPLALAGRVKPALWKLSDADTTIYLFGTIHTLRPGTDWYDADLQKAFEASQELVIEALETDPMKAASSLLTRAIDPDGRPLSKKLTPADARRYRAAMDRLGLPIHDFESLEPWFVAMILSSLYLQQLGYGAGVDAALLERAMESAKPVIPLETLDLQLSIFDELPERSQINILNQTIQSLNQPPTQLQHVTHLWATGQAERLAESMKELRRDMPAHYSDLIIKRNRRWTDWLAQRLDRPGTVFVAVGAAHFAGEDSVLRMLRARQLRVTRLR